MRQVPSDNLKTRARRAQASGFTLIEVLISLIVIVLAVVPIFVLTVSSRQLALQAQYQAVAYDVAREELETLRAQTFTSSRVTGNNSVSFTSSIPSSASSQFPNSNITGSYKIYDVTSTYGDSTHQVQQIVVTVNWSNASSSSGTASSVRLDSLIAQGAGK